MKEMSNLLIAMLFVFQLIMIMMSKSTGYWYFSWAPHDIQTEYKLSVYADGQSLAASQIEAFFSLKKVGVIDQPPSHFSQWMTPSRLNPIFKDTIAITLDYRVNGNEWQLDQISYKKNEHGF